MRKHKTAEKIHPNELGKFIAATKVHDQAGNAIVFRVWADDSDYKIQVGIADPDDLFGEVYSFGLDRSDLRKLGSLFLAAARLS